MAATICFSIIGGAVIIALAVVIIGRSREEAANRRRIEGTQQ